MKNKPLHTYLCAAGISFCLGLGAVGAMASALTLPVKMEALVFLCLLLATVIAGLASLRWGSLITLAFGGILLLRPDFWIELKTVAASLCLRLQLAYGIPIPEFLQEERSEQVLSVLCMIGGLIMVAAAWAVHKRKTAIPATVLSLLPLVCCITVTDTVPDSVWLFLWGLGLILLLMTQGARKVSAAQGNRLTALLAIPTVLVLVLLFWMVPRNAPDRWGIADLPGKILSHFSQAPGPELSTPVSPPKVDLSALEKRQQEQTPIMEVTADFTGPLYLRGRDYDEYTGTDWQCTPGRTEELYGFSPELHEKDGTVEIRVRRPQDIYYLPAITQKVQLITDGQAQNPTKEKTYRFDHCSMRENWQADWKVSVISTVNPRYLRLPDDTMQGAWAYLNAQEETSAAALSDLTAPAAAEQIRQLVSSHVPYSLNTPNMPTGEPDLALWFLNEAETGYCVHYATAAVVLLRACGIPARYVEGYAISVQKGETATVRELHAHAWVEYYVNGAGWVVLDATPGDSSDPEEPTTTAPTETQPVTTTAPSQPTAPTTDSTTEEQPPVRTPKSLPTWVKTIVKTLVWACAALVLLLGQYRLRRSLFRRSIRQGSHNQRALRIHRRLCRLSKWTKKPVPEELTQLAQKARFSPHTLTKSELSQLQGHLQLTESAVSLLPIYKRLPAKWLFARY